MKVGFVGLGVMGSGMAANLIKNGFDLTVFARDPAKAQRHVQMGAQLAGGLPELAGKVDVVVLSLPNTQTVESVLFEPSGLSSSLVKGIVVIDTSTIDATATRSFAARLARQGISLLDAPVSGGQKGAEDGTLTCMVGGSADAFVSHEPVLRGFAKTVTLIGESGAGQICKACNGICVVASMLAASEVVALCLKSGIDPHIVRQALLGGAAQSSVLENHARRLVDRSFVPGFRAELMLKDLRIASETLKAAGIASSVTSGAEPLLSEMVAKGLGGLDWSAIGMLVQERAGLEMRLQL